MADIVGSYVWVRGNPRHGIEGKGSGLNVTEFVHNGHGSFTIYFNFPVAGQCVEIASIGEEAPGLISAYGEPENPNAVQVRTWHRPTVGNPSPTDFTFQLLVVQ
jgi:hypothetical protein